jgi:hypothetical protein
MDPNEFLKLAPHLQSIATTIVAGVPVAEVVKRIVLPSADALGERMKNRVERCFAKMAKMIEDAGVTPQPVEDKLVVEILRGASLEDNDDLHTMWAALLANAASQENAQKVRPSFIAILRQMAHDEAALLNWLCVVDCNTNSVSGDMIVKAYSDLMNTPTPQPLTTMLCLQNLQAIQLVEPIDGARWMLTPRAISFVEACRPPKPKE